MSELQDRLLANLDSYWQKIVDDLVKSLYDVGRVASGVTAQNIGALNSDPIKLTASGFSVIIAMPDYYQFLDEGVSGAQFNKGISRFKYTNKMPPIKAIRKFMLNRGINSPKRSNTKSGKRRDAESIRNGIAFAIARSIWSKGLKKTNFYSNVINDKQLEVFERQLLEQYGEFILEIIRID